MIRIAERHLMALLNRLGDRVEVRAPLLQDARLFTLDLSQAQAIIEQVISDSEYGSKVPRIRKEETYSQEIASEIPLYTRLRDCFVASGVIRPNNWEEINQLLTDARRSNPARGGDIYYFAFDNNAVRNRVYSLYLKPRHRGHPEPNLVLSEIVRQELDLREGKIGGKFLKAFSSAFPGVGIEDMFSNQNRLQDRLRLLALAEWSAMQRAGNFQSVGSKVRRRLEDWDGRILDSCERFAKHAGRKVVLLSSDNELIQRSCGLRNLIPCLISYPPLQATEYEAEWECVRRLLYHLAVVYGRIDLRLNNGTCVRLYGVWKQKGSPDWDKERVKVRVEPSGTLLETALKRTLAVLEAVGEA
ncbi:hypothetical protein DCOP10_123124 [Armatimonadetes bacterium DC]|nr:hypothetical protein DCOP10_123124 [Armatimonadetes bacterium DC]